MESEFPLVALKPAAPVTSQASGGSANEADVRVRKRAEVFER